MGRGVWGRGGGGCVGDSNMKMPGRVCWVSENLPILNDTFSRKKIPILKGSSTQFKPIFDVD